MSKKLESWKTDLKVETLDSISCTINIQKRKELVGWYKYTKEERILLLQFVEQLNQTH